MKEQTSEEKRFIQVCFDWSEELCFSFCEQSKVSISQNKGWEHIWKRSHKKSIFFFSCAKREREKSKTFTGVVFPDIISRNKAGEGRPKKPYTYSAHIEEKRAFFRYLLNTILLARSFFGQQKIRWRKRDFFEVKSCKTKLLKLWKKGLFRRTWGVCSVLVKALFTFGTVFN